MADNTIIQQGNFIATGNTIALDIRSDVDWMKVYNATIAAADQTTAIGVEYYWQRGFPAGSMWRYRKSNAANAANLSQFITPGGFTLADTSIITPGAAVALTAIDNAQPPEVTTASTAALVDGDVVRIIDVTGAQQLGGIDFTIDVTSATTFQLEYMSAIVAGTTGFYRKIDVTSIFYPRRRFITKISLATNAIVTLSVTHGYTVGQKIRFNVPAAYGMVQMNGLQGTIIAIGQADVDGTTNTVTVDIDSSAFTAFAFPLTAAVPFTPAQVIPIGEDTGSALILGADILADATRNAAFIGMFLAGGANSPGGAVGDTMYWVAGKSFNVDNI